MPPKTSGRLTGSDRPKKGSKSAPSPFYLREDPPPYCHTCGRVMSKVQKDHDDKKYCSGTCRRRKPNRQDIAIEEAFVDRLQDTQGTGERKLVSCDELETSFFGSPEDRVKPPDFKRSSGELKALQREQVRRAARRGVVFGFSKYGGLARWPLCEAVQEGRVVEPSFAKGDFSIRWRE